MKANFECPVCFASEWTKCQTYSYQTNNYLHPINLNNPAAKYIAQRQHILSYIWFADNDKIELTSLICKKCGFMCYTPRPTATDLDNKYAFLGKIEKIGATHDTGRSTGNNLEKRSNHLFSIIKKYKKGQEVRVLDYGGGDGGLLKHFVKQEIDCYLVDYNEKPIPGVKRLGSTIANLSPGLLFDVIICSHVLEHVADPVRLLEQLRTFLKDDGIVYLEVPVEVWEEIPLQHDPVTHINFFTKNSLQTAIVQSHYKSRRIKYDFQPYGFKYKRVTWAIISKNDNFSKGFYKPEKTFSLLHPGPVKKIQRALENIWLNQLNNKKAF